MSLEDWVDKLRHWGRPWAAGSEPLEIHRAILEDVAAQAVSIGGGRRVFPFDRVEVKLLAASPEERVRLEAIAQAGWDLEREVKDRLRAAEVRVPPDLAVSVQVTEERLAEFGERHYALVCRKTAPAEADRATAEVEGDDGGRERPGAGRAGRPLLRLTVLKGKAARDAYELDRERVYIGRLEEVLDAGGRVQRRNDVAFLEEGEVSQTVSREHARIAWDAESRAFWLRDEGSASGTLLLRSGRSIEVSRHDRRGVRLESGDEVYLGRAAVRVELAGAS
jgi:hypothetical protein